MHNPYGKKEEKLFKASDVERGLACNCICPACGHKLQAHQGNKISPYFSHYRGSDCGSGYETALHLLAKEVLLKERKVLLPELKLKSEKSIWMPGIDYETTLLVKPWQIVNIDSVELEVKIGNIIPDVIVRKKDRILFIEIKVTHGIDDKKLAYIKENNINVIEYDFSKSRNIIEEDHIKNVLTTSYKGAKKGFGRGEWVNHCKMKETIEQLNESYKEKVRKHKKSELPINKEPSIKSTTDDIENAQIKKSYDYKPYH